MARIALKRDWELGGQIGAGGFGRVYAAKSDSGEPAVIKMVPKAPGAEREHLFVDLHNVRNVIPVLDSGDAGDCWAIVMPRAEMSLRQYLDNPENNLDDTAIASILNDIATALADMDGKVVHRDLKPENILLLKGAWCLADFGIARYAEAATAPDTQKYALSPPYSAPERWHAERATIASDVYSFGVIAFELLTRTLPFPGPDLANFRDQHLHKDARDISGEIPAALKALVTECLYKAAGARPSPARILTTLGRIGLGPVSDGRARLRQAHLAEVARRSEAERVASAGRTQAERRRALLKSAMDSGKAIRSALYDAIRDAAPTAAGAQGKRNGDTLALGQAQIEFTPIVATPENPWNWEPPTFDVIAHAMIILRVPRDRYDYEGRAHSLWYCDAGEKTRFQWFETAFMMSPLIGRSTAIRPFALDPGEDAAKGFWSGVAELQLAWPLAPIDTGDLEEFIDRWASWFADASQGRLRSPSTMPERPTPRDWRRK